MKLIGRRDRIDLPELALFDIEAKIDTGAYGAALHCHQIKLVQEENRTLLSFKILDPDHPDYHGKEFLFEEFNDKIVKSSSGQAEHRYTIRTDLILFGKRYKVDFSLTDRKSMKYPILIGRKFLYKKFFVDVQKKDLSFKQKTQ